MRRKKNNRGSGAIKVATSDLDCRRCPTPIKKGWSYSRTSSGEAEHYNATHWPACHDPRECIACLKPGRRLLGANYVAKNS